MLKHIKTLSKLTSKMGSKDYKELSPVMKKTMSNVINESIEDDLKKINCPTLLLFGNNDKITPKYLAKKIKKHIADCETITQNGNHFAYLYNKYQTIKIIESMVNSHD